MAKRDIIVIGGSAGAAEPFKQIVKSVPNSFAAPIFVVLHVDPAFGHLVAESMARGSAIPFEIVDTPRPIEPRHLYFPAPDHHLLVKPARVMATRGPHENLWRPAIDVLFRSAAVAYGSRVIAVLLSGELDDGTVGLAAVKRCGGTTIIQDPAETANPEMVEVAARNVPIDHRLPAKAIAELLSELTRTEAPSFPDIPQDLIEEVAFAEPLHVREHPERGEGPSIFSCPECGGPLWEHAGEGGLRFRCLVGHSYRAASLLQAAAMESERTLWAAVRLFEQRMHLERRMADQETSKGRDLRARIYRERSQESERHVRTLRELLKRSQCDV